MKTLRATLFILGTAVLLVEVGVRATGLYRTETERIFGRYDSYFDQTWDSWYHTWPANDTVPVDHGVFRYDHPTNSIGVREREIPPNKDTTRPRMVFFGDSYVEGVGTTYDSSFVRHVAHGLGVDEVDVFNLGVSGSDVVYDHVRLRDGVDELRPDIVIFALNTSDVDDIRMRGGMERFQPDGTVRSRSAPWIQPVHRASHLVRAIMDRLGYDHLLRSPEARREEDRQALDIMHEALRQTDSLCRAQGIAFHVCLVPLPPTLCVYGADDRMDAFRSLDHSYPVLDLLEPMRDRVRVLDDCTDIRWRIDRHYNAFGYSLVGESFLEVWKERE